MRNLIIGFGEIGKGLSKVLNDNHETVALDKNLDLPLPEGDFDVLNICIPGGLQMFVDIVNDYIALYNPTLTIVHSTVAVGTCRKLDGLVAHSPVRGIHPKMEEGIRTYVKYIGYNEIAAKDFTEKFYKEAKIPFKSFYKTETTELAKILSTTRYGVSLAFAKHQAEICDELGLSYEEVITDWEKSYNKGLLEAGLPQYQRPVLFRPGKKIGGHCVIENAYMLLKTLHPTHENYNLRQQLRVLLDTGKGDRELEY